MYKTPFSVLGDGALLGEEYELFIRMIGEVIKNIFPVSFY